MRPGQKKIPKVVRFALTTKEPIMGKGSKFHEQISRMTVYLHDICYPRDAIVDTGASISVVGSSQIRDIPHQLLSIGKSRVLVLLTVRLGQQIFEHNPWDRRSRPDQNEIRVSAKRKGRGSHKPANLKWNIGPNLTLEECEEMLALLREF